jgi:transcription-repair coupling factor (superfamily II helicase)
MDRLLCGDVGYGKTEVAMRAAFKALGDGKQVAVLAPTTVLASSISKPSSAASQPFPVRIEMLSRFRSAKEIKPLEKISPRAKSISPSARTGCFRKTSSSAIWAW